MTKYLVGAKERGGPCCRLSRQRLWLLRSVRNEVIQRVGRLCLSTTGVNIFRVLPVLEHFRKVWTNNGVSLLASGHAHNCVVNNNGLESTNGKIQDLVTQRHLMPLLDFLRAIMGWITSKSVILDSTNVNYKPFAPHNSAKKVKEWHQMALRHQIFDFAICRLSSIVIHNAVMSMPISQQWNTVVGPNLPKVAIPFLT